MNLTKSFNRMPAASKTGFYPDPCRRARELVHQEIAYLQWRDSGKRVRLPNALCLLHPTEPTKAPPKLNSPKAVAWITGKVVTRMDFFLTWETVRNIVQEELKVVYEKMRKLNADNQAFLLAAINAKNAEEPALLTAEQLCTKLNISEKTLYRWKKKRRIPSVPFGSGKKPGVRYVLADVLMALKQYERKAV